jgi:hypothetical protein
VIDLVGEKPYIQMTVMYTQPLFYPCSHPNVWEDLVALLSLLSRHSSGFSYLLNRGSMRCLINSTLGHRVARLGNTAERTSCFLRLLILFASATLKNVLQNTRVVSGRFVDAV